MKMRLQRLQGYYQGVGLVESFAEALIGKSMIVVGYISDTVDPVKQIY